MNECERDAHSFDQVFFEAFEIVDRRIIAKKCCSFSIVGGVGGNGGHE